MTCTIMPKMLDIHFEALEDDQRHIENKGGIHGFDASTPTKYVAIPTNICTRLEALKKKKHSTLKLTSSCQSKQSES
ncbi:unnamed protein product [Spirodela intermedia]|uniref:Uncharacterized protein n=1 Tax=Spirodela intermedia TaxID=51605 RepID=A0A7I8LHM1_SPIIN|nr:unnamed protein product [Spirodela intermedia]